MREVQVRWKLSANALDWDDFVAWLEKNRCTCGVNPTTYNETDVDRFIEETRKPFKHKFVKYNPPTR